MTNRRTQSICKPFAEFGVPFSFREHQEFMMDCNRSLWNDFIENEIKARVANEDEAIETALSCACAGVPLNSMRIQCFNDFDKKNLAHRFGWRILFNEEEALKRKSVILEFYT